MREIRIALLRADVNLGVVKEFVAAVKERSLGAELSKALNPSQQIIKIVNEERNLHPGRRGPHHPLRETAPDGHHAHRPAGRG